MRIGQSKDVHRLVEGRKLIIGGVEIPYEKGLLGHSDADVLLHAIIEALIGAMGLKDIGTHFPDTDPRYEGISSLLLLDKTCELLEENGMLGPNFLSAHNVSLTEHDITILKKYDAKIVHCPTSNLSNHGFPNTPRFLDEGMVVALGSDGASSTSLSLFEKMRLMRYAMTA